jgi:hypothetical protein
MGVSSKGSVYSSDVSSPQASWRSTLFFNTPIFAGVMLPGVIGYLTALAMSVVEKRLLTWRSIGPLSRSRHRCAVSIAIRPA